MSMQKMSILFWRQAEKCKKSIFNRPILKHRSPLTFTLIGFQVPSALIVEFGYAPNPQAIPADFRLASGCKTSKGILTDTHSHTGCRVWHA